MRWEKKLFILFLFFCVRVGGIVEAKEDEVSL
jgi:hypothetical protein